ncbi:MAG TPA: YafY family protein [Blastocatellia bacterium]|nr:YafY family protein [Blastocatellia bacterium]
MRSGRLLSILLQLQVNKRVTARDLAKRLEVSQRTIHRDMDALSAAGVPVFAERGAGGGWSLLEEYRTDLTGLNKAEVEALFLPHSDLLADLGLEDASRRALIKLLAAIPSTHRDPAQYASQRIHVDTSGWNRPEESIPFLPLAQQAVWEERKLRITYLRGPESDPVERLVEPLGLIAKGSVWYLMASVEGSTRSYRISRISGAEITSENFVRPKNFDLAAVWEQSTATFKASLPKYIAVFRTDPSIKAKVRYAGRFARIENVEAEDETGWSKITIRFQFEEEACEYALGFGPRIEVLEPESLRMRVIETARQVVAFYENPAARECL